MSKKADAFEVVLSEPYWLVMILSRMFFEDGASDKADAPKRVFSLLHAGRRPASLTPLDPTDPSKPLRNISTWGPDQDILLYHDGGLPDELDLGLPVQRSILKLEPRPEGRSHLSALHMLGGRRFWRYYPDDNPDQHEFTVQPLTAEHQPVGGVLQVCDASFYAIRVRPEEPISQQLLSSITALRITLDGVEVVWDLVPREHRSEEDEVPIIERITDEVRDLIFFLERITWRGTKWVQHGAVWMGWVNALLGGRFPHITINNPEQVFETLESRFFSLPGQILKRQISKKPAWMKVAGSLPESIGFQALWQGKTEDGFPYPVITITFVRLYSNTAIGFQFGRVRADHTYRDGIEPVRYGGYDSIRDLYLYCFSRLLVDPELRWVAGAVRAKYFLSAQFDFAIWMKRDQGCSLPLRLIEINLPVLEDGEDEVSIRNLKEEREDIVLREVTWEDEARCQVLLKRMNEIRPPCYMEAYDFKINHQDKLFLDDSVNRFKFLCGQSNSMQIEPSRTIFMVEKEGEPLMAGILDAVTPGLSITGVLDQLRFVPFRDEEDEEMWLACRRLITRAVREYRGKGVKSFMLSFEGELAGPPDWRRIGLSSRIGQDYGPGFTWVLSMDVVPAFLSYVEQWTGTRITRAEV